ncbi:hypothetical protein IW140_006121 [Coemansia sp. RSA 1813]|nr:hypothetical protein EV178_006098 [Coemansia sp. RSA 1646]KAJ1767034.1 hypothetical protein LPJ74_005578 [Coemansia sp. RSA 1843]KAJ2085850.1 hypothetical protein IW138_006080 [Coemansia sp. RSA 986]KAJ2210700.1 hypothetical protein EV179_006058 [Coemansia sp. RSA 487]KAJ2563438.1 hypothetical protein IW140_006121 [Coemansia sp. RSA 1813]
MRCIRVNKPDEFDDIVTEAATQSNAVFVLFFGRETPETNESWCPDCVVADPFIRKAISTVENSILLEVPIDRSTATTSPTAVFRQREDIRLEKVPTLLRWTASGPSSIRLVEDECHTEEGIAEFAAKTDGLNRVPPAQNAATL